MRHDLNRRTGFDRVLMAVAATFMTVSATSAFAQSAPPTETSRAAIDAAIPMPEPANVPPPTASDFKSETTGAVAPAADTTKAAVESTPAPEKAAVAAPAMAPAAAPSTAAAPATPSEPA